MSKDKPEWIEVHTFCAQEGLMTGEQWTAKRVIGWVGDNPAIQALDGVGLLVLHHQQWRASK